MPAPRSARKTRGTTPVVDRSMVDSTVAQRREVLSGRNQGYGTIGEAGITKMDGKVASQQQVASTLEEAVSQARSDIASFAVPSAIRSRSNGTQDDSRSQQSQRSSRGRGRPPSKNFADLQSVPEEKAESSIQEDEDEEELEEESMVEEGEEGEDDDEEAEEEQTESHIEVESKQSRSGLLDRDHEETELQRTFTMESRARNRAEVVSIPANERYSPTSQAATEYDRISKSVSNFELWRHTLLALLLYSALCIFALAALNRVRGRPFFGITSGMAAENVVYHGSPDSSDFIQAIKSIRSDVSGLGKRMSAMSADIGMKNLAFEKLQEDVWGIAKIVRKAKPESQPIRRVNFLSPTEMASVDTRLTSPTATRSVQGLALGLVAKLSGGILADQSIPFGKHEYLQEDTTILRRNWCSNSVNGVAQKGWQLGYNMTPTELVLSWPSKTETVDGRSAPRDIELWVDLSFKHEKTYISQVKSLADKTWPGIMNAPTFVTKNGGQIRSNIVPWTMVPIGKWQYDLHSNKREQRFEVQIDIGQHKTDRVALRINSNWGNQQMVCLQDVALHGHYRGVPIEYAV